MSRKINMNVNTGIMWAAICALIVLVLIPSTNASELATRAMPSLHLEMACENGGVGYGGRCMCPAFVTGERCEVANVCEDRVAAEYAMLNPFTHKAKQICTHECEISPSLLCCWRNRLIELGQPNNATDEAGRIKNMLEQYGPWTPNDRLMLDYFFGEQGTEGKYITKAPTTAPASELEELNIAFVIMLHNEFDRRLPSLLDNIYSTKHTYMIHVDQNTDAWHWDWVNKYIANFTAISKTNNIHLVKNRFHGAWGSISLVYLNFASIIELLRVGDENGGSKWTHVINLSGYDFPLKPIKYIEQFLYKNKETNFMEFLGDRREFRQKELHLSCGRTVMLTNFTEDNVCDLGSHNWMFQHRPSWVYGEGSQWHILTREFVEYMVSSMDMIELLFSMKYTLIPDEAFFQSAVLSSPFASKIFNYNYRFLPWADQLNVMEKHVPDMRNSNALFVRKLIDPKMADVIVRDVLSRYADSL